MELFISIILVVALIIATITDIRSQRIYNWLTFPLILSGLLFHTLDSGLDGLMLSGSGFALGLGLMIVPFFLGLMGAGDVKLMAGIGAWLGLNATFTAFLFTCVAGGVYAIIILIQHLDAFKASLANIWSALVCFMATRKFEFTPTASVQALPRLCYGVAIAVGTIGAMLFHYTYTGSILIR